MLENILQYAVAGLLLMLLIVTLVEDRIESRKARAARDAQWWNPENWLP